VRQVPQTPAVQPQGTSMSDADTISASFAHVETLSVQRVDGA
jgi:hypothetical protein